jgi:predicted RecA/RadA family phage recombinase
LVGVAIDTAAAGSLYTLATRGEFEVAKEATATGSVGQGNKTYYMTTTGGDVQATSEAASGKIIGIWSEGTTTGATTAKVLLMGLPLLVAI